MVRLDQRFTHPDDVAIMQRVHALAEVVADAFGMKLLVVEHKRRPHSGGTTGLCYQDEFRISIAARYRDGKNWWKRPFPWSSIANTTIHEVAHLGGLPDNQEHRALQANMTEWVKINHPEMLRDPVINEA